MDSKYSDEQTDVAEVEHGAILLVDDDPIVLEVTAARLRNLGHQVVMACGGAEALTVSLRGVDLVVTDLAMPDVDGFAVLSHVHAHDPMTPVIVLSGHTEMDCVLDAIRQGAFDYVLKDGTEEPLAAAVRRALSQVRLERRNIELVAELREVNHRLEDEIADRTAQLRASNEILRTEREQLRETVSTLKSTQARLIQAEKIASVGMLTAGVAHEINNPLSFLLPNVAYVGETIDAMVEQGRPFTRDSEEVVELKDLLGDCEFGLSRIEKVVGQLKLFARPDEPENSRVSLGEIVDTLLKFTRSEVRHYAEIHCDVDPACYVNVCVSQLQQVLLNLIVNAAHAIPDDRPGIISVRAYPNDDFVCIDVSDNGVGISQAEQVKIFEPFYTTRRDKEGTGLGLSISLELTKKMGGKLSVHSVEGQGTTMTVVLPACTEERSRPAVVDTKSLCHASKTILLVDDEAATLRALSRVLAKRHSTVAFTSGCEALDWLTAHPRPDLVLCDLMMPEMSGPQLYRRSVQLDPEIGKRFVFVTGGAVTPEAHEFIQTTVNPVIMKPLTDAKIRDLPRLVAASHSVTSSTSVEKQP